MTLNTTAMDDDLKAIIADLPQSFTWSGKDYACVADDLTLSDRHVEVGFMDEATLVFYTRQSLFATLPTFGQTLTYNGGTYRIESVVKDPSGVGLRINCKDETG